MFSIITVKFDNNVVRADTGVMGGLLSEEFQAITDIGEDTIVLCDKCDFSSNLEIATTISNNKDNEAEKEIFKMGLTHHYEYERIERSPFFNIVYGALTNRPCDIENAAKSLSEMNLDLIVWPTYNSYRKDIEIDIETKEKSLKVIKPVNEMKKIGFDEKEALDYLKGKGEE